MPGALFRARDLVPSDPGRRQPVGREPARVASLPDGLSRKRHRELEGVYWPGLVVRRIGYVLLAAVAVLALLDVFGQRPTTATRDAAAAKLQVYAPTHL